MTNLDEEWLFTLDFHVNQDIFLKIYNHLHLGLLLTLVFQMKISLVLYMGGETGCNCLMAFISFKDNFENHRRFDWVVYWTFAHPIFESFNKPWTCRPYILLFFKPFTFQGCKHWGCWKCHGTPFFPRDPIEIYEIQYKLQNWETWTNI